MSGSIQSVIHHAWSERELGQNRQTATPRIGADSTDANSMSFQCLWIRHYFKHACLCVIVTLQHTNWQVCPTLKNEGQREEGLYLFPGCAILS